MPRDYRLYLDDILEAIDRINQYVGDMDESEFSLDKKTQDAVARNLEIIGEATRNLPDAVLKEAEEIEWRKIIALRNMLTHEYFDISLPVIWDIIQTKLTPLKEACLKLLKRLDGGLEPN